MIESSSAHSHIVRSTLDNIQFLQSQGLLDESKASQIRSNLEPLLSTPTASLPSITRSIPRTSKVPPPPSKPKNLVPPPPTQQVIALWTFTSTSPDELSFSENEILTIISKADKDWWKGKSEATGKIGMFPASYVEDTKVARELLGSGPPGYEDGQAQAQGLGEGNGKWKAPVARFGSSGNEGDGDGKHNGGSRALVPNTEEQRLKQEKLKKLGGTVGTAAVGGFAGGIGFGLASAIF